MLIDIDYKRYLGYDEKTKMHSCEFELTDGEFGSVVGVGVGSAAGSAWAGAVIAEYSKRNLNVAANLMKLLLLYQKRYGYSIQQYIEWWMLYQPLFPQYKEKLEKYLVLI